MITIRNYIHTFIDFNNLELFLSAPEMQLQAESAKSMLVQVFSAINDAEMVRETVQRVEGKYPAAIICGATTLGEIAYGCLQLNSIVLSMTFFDSTAILPICKPCISGKERETGEDLIQNIYAVGGRIAGVLLFATPLRIDLAEVFSGMQTKPIDFPVFGGGAGAYDLTQESLVFCGGDILESGIVVIAFFGDELHIYSDSHLGWQPLTREMTVTDCDGRLVKTVDNQSVYDLYNKYLNIKQGDDFFLNVLEFPFILKRDGYTVARVPFFLREDGSVEFVADVHKGDKFRLGYGDPELILRNSESIQREMHQFQPQAIFIYSCICRRFLMQDDINLEFLPFDSITDTVGFFTTGEFSSSNGKIRLLNSTTVVVGMREGAQRHTQCNGNPAALTDAFQPMSIDPYSDKHTRIISQLLHFINALSSELEQANDELTLLSEIDKLTQISNRLKLDNILTKEIFKNGLNKTVFSVILFDVDHFKEENDIHGHISGDTILVELTGLLKPKVRKTDTFGRWGGDEFLLILPLANLDQACSIAENLRAEVDSHPFEGGKHVTCSFGVASFHGEDDVETLILRADKALYLAKNNGRNRVECWV